MDNIYLTIALTVIVILLTIFIIKRFKKPLNLILLIGQPDAGKTAIFSRLVFNRPKKTITSLKENEAIIRDLNIRLIDLPGAERLRVRLWEHYRNKAKHIMYVIDSTKIDSNLRDVCEYLYQILADELVYKNNTSVTVVCHKQDLSGKKDKEAMRSILEDELNAIKNSKKVQLGKTSDEEERDYLIARFDKDPISFGTLSINLIETSIDNLDQLIKTIL